MYSIEGVAGQDRRFALKHATDAAHRRVESVVQAASMFSSPGGYRSYLQATYAMRAGAENLLDAAGAGLIWARWPERRIAHVVAEDIADLGDSPPVPSAIQKRFRAQMSPGELVGALYVLEGSALGTRILVKLASEIGMTATRGARHLHLQAEDRGAWRDFIAVMSALDDPPCHLTANKMFEAFARAYERAS